MVAVEVPASAEQDGLGDKRQVAFVSGEFCMATGMPPIRRSVWDDPVVAEFARTGTRPKWDVEAFIKGKNAG